MRKVLLVGFFIGILICIISIVLPTKQTARIFLEVGNNINIVHSEITNLEPRSSKWTSLLECVNIKKRRESCFSFQKDGKSYIYKYKYLDSINEVLYDLLHINGQILYTGNIRLEDKDDKFTLLTITANSEPTLNPFKRFYYLFNSSELQEGLHNLLIKFKNVVEDIPYKSYHLSTEKIVKRQDLVLCFNKSTTVSCIQNIQDYKISEVLQNRLIKYKLVDTLRESFVEYIDWSKDKVRYKLCIPLLYYPTKKQLYWLKGGKVDTISGRYLSAIFMGEIEKLPLAWDSLYSISRKKQYTPVGLPLEQVIKIDNDSLMNKVKRQLFIRVE